MPPKAKFTKQQIAEAGLDIIRNEGMENLTARALGKRLGSSACPIFTVFENMEEVQLRALKSLKKLAAQYNGKTIAITTHAGVIRALQCLWQKLPLSEMKNITWVGNASICLVEYDNDEFIPKQIGYNQHLNTIKTNLPKNI